MDKYESLKLKNQICFPLYAAGKEITRKYQPILKELDLTYTQYIVMMVLWEEKQIKVKDLGEKLFLDSGTLTPLLKKLETKGYLSRNKDENDDRNLIIKIEQKGLDLREKALSIPQQIAGCVNLDEKEAITLYELLYKVLTSK